MWKWSGSGPVRKYNLNIHMLVRFNFICKVVFMNDQDSLDKNTLIGRYLWTTHCLLDNWDRVLLFVMNSKWLITWEGHSECLVSQAGILERKMLSTFTSYAKRSFWVSAGSSSLLIIINICRWPSLCKLLNHPHPVGDETWHRFSQDLGTRSQGTVTGDENWKRQKM